MPKPLQSGETIGILGGGQLGKMLSSAATRLGLQVHIYDPSTNPIASHTATHTTKGNFDDTAALEEFATSVDVITYEFENVPANAIDALEKHCPVFPPKSALSISQDRLSEKDFVRSLGLHTAPYATVDSATDLRDAVTQIGTPSILKTRRFGYDGKGQVRILADTNLENAWSEIDAPAVLEGFVDFRCEISVIGARSQDGAIVCFPPGENVHRNGILHTTTIPAAISDEERTTAIDMANTILTSLEYVGVIGVELFVTENGIIVNEFAPRVHNSGHWTQDGCAVDQFEQHIRAIAGWELGDGSAHSNVTMTNLIGDDILNVEHREADNNVVHIYGKEDVRPGRKMGHMNRITRTT